MGWKLHLGKETLLSKYSSFISFAVNDSIIVVVVAFSIILQDGTKGALNHGGNSELPRERPRAAQAQQAALAPAGHGLIEALHAILRHTGEMNGPVIPATSLTAGPYLAGAPRARHAIAQTHGQCRSGNAAHIKLPQALRHAPHAPHALQVFPCYSLRQVSAIGGLAWPCSAAILKARCLKPAAYRFRRSHSGVTPNASTANPSTMTRRRPFALQMPLD